MRGGTERDIGGTCPDGRAGRTGTPPYKGCPYVPLPQHGRNVGLRHKGRRCDIRGNRGGVAKVKLIFFDRYRGRARRMPA